MDKRNVSKSELAKLQGIIERIQKETESIKNQNADIILILDKILEDKRLIGEISADHAAESSTTTEKAVSKTLVPCYFNSDKLSPCSNDFSR